MAGSTPSVRRKNHGEGNCLATRADVKQLANNILRAMERMLHECPPTCGDGVRHRQYPVTHEVQQRIHAQEYDVASRGRVTSTHEVQQRGHARGHGISSRGRDSAAPEVQQGCHARGRSCGTHRHNNNPPQSMSVVDGAAPVIHSPCSPKKLTPNVGISTTTNVPTSKKHVPQIPCEEESPQSKIPQLESDKKSKLSDSTKSEEECPLSKIPPLESEKKNELSDSTKCEEECPLSTIPYIESEKSEVSESTKCEDQVVHHEIRGMKDLHLDIPHIEGEKINELCESTKCEIEIIPHLIREISDPQPNIPHNKSERISELCESTKCEVEIFQQENSEMSDPPPWEISSPPNEKREEHSITNLSQNSLSLQYVQVQKAYLSALLQRWEIEIQEQIWRTWSTTTQGACVKIDFQKGIQVLNEVKQKGSSILMKPEVCTYEFLKQWRDKIREKLFGTSSIQQYDFVNLEEAIKDPIKLNVAHDYSSFSFPSYFVLSLCYNFAYQIKLRTTFLLERKSDKNMMMMGYKFVLHGNICWKELLSRTKHHVCIVHKIAKLKTKILYIMKPLHYDLVLPCFLLCDDQVESRTTPFQERGDDEDISVIETRPIIPGQTPSCDKQVHDQMQHNSKVKATNEDCIISLHGYYLLPFYLSFVDQRESRTTLHQGREDDEHMGTSYMTFQKSAQFSWKELLSRIKQTHGQVNANLSSYHNLEHMAALSSPLLLVELRYHMEEIQQPMSS